MPKPCRQPVERRIRIASNHPNDAPKKFPFPPRLIARAQRCAPNTRRVERYLAPVRSLEASDRPASRSTNIVHHGIRVSPTVTCFSTGDCPRLAVAVHRRRVDRVLSARLLSWPEPPQPTPNERFDALIEVNDGRHQPRSFNAHPPSYPQRNK